MRKTSKKYFLGVLLEYQMRDSWPMVEERKEEGRRNCGRVGRRGG